MKFKALLLFGILLFLVGAHLYEAYEAWYNGDEDLVNVFLISMVVSSLLAWILGIRGFKIKKLYQRLVLFLFPWIVLASFILAVKTLDGDFTPETRLKNAVRAENRERIARILKKNDVEQWRLNSLLFYAVRSCKLRSLEPLDKGGADVNHVGSNSRTPYITAQIDVRGNYFGRDCSRLISAELVKLGAHPVTIDKHRVTDLHRSVLEGDLEKLDSLLLKGTIPVDFQDIDGNSALIYAIEKNNVGAVQVLLQYGANVNARGRRYREIIGDTGISALAIASMEGFDVRIVELLLEYGAITSEEALAVSYDKYYPPLYNAIATSNLEAVQLLLDHGAIFNPEDFKEAMESTSKEIILLLNEYPVNNG